MGSNPTFHTEMKAKPCLVDRLRPSVTVYGPYTAKQDGRKRVVLYTCDDAPRVTVSYPKWLMEQHLGRLLTRDETVDHKDRDFTNDSLDNLQILTRLNHVKLDSIRRAKITLNCVWCKNDFAPNTSFNQRCRSTSGPFCSRRCSGIYGASLRNGDTEVMPLIPIERKYVTRDKVTGLDIPVNRKPYGV